MKMLARVMLFAAITAKLFGQATGNNFDQWDVFTDRTLTGNQVAVFIDPKGLDANTMMDIAREFDFRSNRYSQEYGRSRRRGH